MHPNRGVGGAEVQQVHGKLGEEAELKRGGMSKGWAQARAGWAKAFEGGRRSAWLLQLPLAATSSASGERTCSLSTYLLIQTTLQASAAQCCPWHVQCTGRPPSLTCPSHVLARAWARRLQSGAHLCLRKQVRCILWPQHSTCTPGDASSCPAWRATPRSSCACACAADTSCWGTCPAAAAAAVAAAGVEGGAAAGPLPSECRWCHAPAVAAGVAVKAVAAVAAAAEAPLIASRVAALASLHAAAEASWAWQGGREVTGMG